GKEYQLSVLAEAMVHDRPAVGVNVSSRGHEDVKLYFDKESGLLVKRVQRLDDGMGDKVTQEELFSDYQETDKVKLPRKYVPFADGKRSAEGQVPEVQFLDRIADTEFDKPAPADAPRKEENKQTGEKEKQPALEKAEDLRWRPARVAGPAGRYLVLVDP